MASTGKKPSKKTGTRKKSASRRPSYHREEEGWRPWLKRAALRVVLIGGLVGLCAFGWLFSTLPDIESLNSFTKKPSIIVKTEDGQIIGSFGDIYGDYVPFGEMPNSLIDAVIATEDRNFYYHFGIDPMGLLRATVANIRAGHVVQGGSTISQQVAKNVFLTPERSLMRKLREMLLAFKLEVRFTKEDILSIYLNRVYLGAGNYGVDSASKRYFGHSARDLRLSESAILAGLLKAPSRYAPTSNPALSRKRADQVLLNMQDAGFLTQEQTDKARKELASSMENRKRAPQSNLYFADWIADQLPEYVGNVQEDIVVITTLRPELQAMADKAVADIMDKDAEKFGTSQAALLAMSPDGAVRAMIGGRNYAESQFNRTYQSLRQPGSSFKMFVYMAGLEAGFRPDTLVEDKPLVIDAGVSGKWQPKNYTGRYLGEIPLRDAVAESINTVAVQVSEHAGLEQVIDMARRLGVTSKIDPLHSIALGAVEVSLLEMTGAYAHLASGGLMVQPYGILQIDTTQGEPVYRRFDGGRTRVVRSDIVGMMSEMLMGVVDRGTGRAARIGRPVAGKTGTTSDYKDAWFIGYTPDLIAGVWVGNDDNKPMKKVTGGGLPARIWHDFMLPAHANIPVHSIPTEGFILPWLESVEQPPGMETKEGRKVELGNSFWEKLMGDNPKPQPQRPPKQQPDIEYSYPTQKRP
jgi:penicillin-binding protein 1A